MMNLLLGADMKEIPLTKGFFSLIDDEDFVKVSAHRWHYARGYAHNAQVGALHRFVIGAPKGRNVDHINGDPLDNRKENLRLATHGQNMMNKHVAWGLSKYKGVIWNKKQSSWLVRVAANGGREFVGAFRDEIEAAKAYNDAALRLHGEYAALNVIDGYTSGGELASPVKVTKPRKKSPGASQYRGVSFNAKRESFDAAISRDGEKRTKRFTDEHAAGAWYNVQAREIFGEHAILNVLPAEFAHYERLVCDEPLAMTPKSDKASKHSNVFRNGGKWMVRIRKGGETIFQKNFPTEDEAAQVAAEMRQLIEAESSKTST